MTDEQRKLVDELIADAVHWDGLRNSPNRQLDLQMKAALSSSCASSLAIAIMLRDMLSHRCECGREVYSNICGKCGAGT